MSFTDIVTNTFHQKSIDRTRYTPTIYTHLTCYILLDCDRGPLPFCLDWREICDGRIDCMNRGVDEKLCFQLEINECEENEFRCPPVNELLDSKTAAYPLLR